MSQDKNSRKIKRRVRRAYTVSTVSMALVLFMLGAVGYLIINARKASDKMRENMSISVMLADNQTQDERTELKNAILKIVGVREVIYKSKEDASKEFKEFVGTDFDLFLDENPIPASYEVKLHAENSDVAAVKAVDKQIVALSGVREVLYQDEIINQISNNLQKFNLVLLLFGGTLLVISLILINNTIRVTIVSKRFIINTMKLVGATRWFIEKPFIKQAVMQGIYATLIASTLLIALIAGLNEGLPEAGLIRNGQELYLIFGAMLTLGIMISVLFTFIVVNKFVKSNSNKIYIY